MQLNTVYGYSEVPSREGALGDYAVSQSPTDDIESHLPSATKPYWESEEGPAATAYATKAHAAKLWQRAIVILACLSWTAVSSLAILVNKHIMVDLDFKYPCTIAWLGLLTTTCASFLVMQLTLPVSQRQPISRNYYMAKVLPTGFFMALTFQTGNTGYLYLTVAFVQMLKAFCPVVTMLLLFMAHLEKATAKLVCSVLLIALGVIMASYGEMNLSIFGLVAMMTSVVAESVRLVLTQYLLVGNGFMPFEGLFYIGSACTVCLTVQASYLEWPGLISTSAFTLVASHPLKFLAAACAGFGVNLLAILVIKMASSLTLKVLGTVKDAGLVTIGVVFLHEQVTALQLTGYSISLMGFIFYNILKAFPDTNGAMAKKR